MKTSSRSYQGHAYNAVDATITDELRQRERDRRIRAAGVAKRRGALGRDEQILALCEWAKLLHRDGKIAAGRAVYHTARRIAAAIAEQERAE